MKTNLLKCASALLMCFLMVLPAAAQKKGQKKTVFKMEIDCGSCVKKIEDNLAWEKGVTDLQCDLKTQTVTVTYKEKKTNDQKLIAAFKKIGMDAKVATEACKTKDAPCCDGHDHKHDEKGHKH